jgi:hypothetical protein
MSAAHRLLLGGDDILFIYILSIDFFTPESVMSAGTSIKE